MDGLARSRYPPSLSFYTRGGSVGGISECAFEVIEGAVHWMRGVPVKLSAVDRGALSWWCGGSSGLPR
jgi:hypothetical protein